MNTKRFGAIFGLVTLFASSVLTGGCAAAPGDEGDEDAMSEDQLAEALSADDASDDPEADTDDTGESEDALSMGDKKMFGLGVDAPAMITSPLYPKLHASWRQGAYSLQTARIVFYADSHGVYDPAKLRTWVDAVKGAGLEPVVGVSVMRNKLNPATNQDERISPLPHKTFRARFWKLIRQFPEVKAWGVVNEPDLELHGVTDKEADGAVYYVDGAVTLRRCQIKKKCAKGVELIAGEFSYQGDANSLPFWKRYGDEILTHVKSKAHPNGKLRGLPRLWAFHPYADTTDGTAHGTRAFSSFLGDLEAKANVPSGTLRVWLTETGTLLEHGGGGKVTCGMSGLNPNGRADLQFRGAQAVFSMTSISRVDRIYWWQAIQAGPGWPGIWDSAMADSNQAPRASYCALTKQPASACTGGTMSRHCGG